VLFHASRHVPKELPCKIGIYLIEHDFELFQHINHQFHLLLKGSTIIWRDVIEELATEPIIQISAFLEINY
jgi:hypothetical protein